MNTATIYALSDPADPILPRYIGRTISNTRRRLFQHMARAYERPNLPYSKWMISLDKQGKLPRVLIYELVESSDAVVREKWWIKFFRPLGCLLNVNDGAGPGPNGYVSELNRQKTIARNKLGLAPDSRRKIGLAQRGEWSHKRKKKWLESPKVQRNNTLASERGRVQSLVNRKPVRCIETGMVYDSVLEGARSNGVNNTQWFISRMKQGKAYKGLHFQYFTKI